MNLSLGLLADFANKSSDAKLNILGIFNRIWAEKYPAVHPEMKLVLRFELHPAEAGDTKVVKIQFRDDVGRALFELEGQMTIPPPPQEVPRGEMLHVDQILGINRFRIERPGRYEFVILVNGDVKGTVPLNVALRQPRPKPAGEQQPS